MAMVTQSGYKRPYWIMKSLDSRLSPTCAYIYKSADLNCDSRGHLREWKSTLMTRIQNQAPEDV